MEGELLKHDLGKFGQTTGILEGHRSFFAIRCLGSGAELLRLISKVAYLLAVLYFQIKHYLIILLYLDFIKERFIK
jgi:hypothetical protein